MERDCPAGDMRTNISKLTTAHLDAVDELMKPHSGTIGFLPREVLHDHLRKEWVLGAIGYLLYAAYGITQLCVAENERSTARLAGVFRLNGQPKRDGSIIVRSARPVNLRSILRFLP